MKMLFAAASAAALLAAAPAVAQTVPSGYIGAGYSWTQVETPFGDADGDALSFDGAVAIPVGQSSWAVQVDGGLTTGDGADSWQGTAHLFTRNNQFAVGAFAGLVDVEDTDAWLVGGEGQIYMTNVTLAGSLGFGQIDDADADLWGLGGEARFFASDNLRFDAGLGWMNTDTGFGDVDTLGFGVGGEFQPATLPVSLFASWVHSEVDDIDVSGNTFTIGARFTFHQSLRERDRSGPSFGSLGGFGGTLSSL